LLSLAFLAALLLFSFAVVAVNVVIRAQRTLTFLKHEDIEKIEGCTFSVFLLFLAAFLLVLFSNIAIYQYSLFGDYGELVGLLIAFFASLSVLFAPQAIVIDDYKLGHAVSMSWKIIRKKFGYFLFFLASAGLLLLLNTWIFMKLQDVFLLSRYIAIVTNALLILPFLEVLKVQIYLSKYSIL
jgi:hypothetical protein